MKLLNNILLSMLLVFAGGISQLYAQSGSDGFNPTNPDDPMVPVFKEYRAVTVGITPSDAGSVSRSGSSSKNGKFEVGTSVLISTSRYTNFYLKHWLKNGEVYSQAGTSTSFYYTVEEEDANFVAVYEYRPSNPSDPNASVKSRLFLQCEPAGACSYTLTNGEAHDVDSYVELGVNPNQDYEFIGWYEGNTLISANASVNYLMPYHDTTLTARFRYTWVFNPANPDDPASQGGDIQTEEALRGDVNNDKMVNVQDVVACVNVILTDSDNNRADVNKDGSINVQDVVNVVNIILNKE